MPNHITNLVTVTGSPSEVAAFVERHITKLTEGRRTGEDHFDFDTVIPMPQSVRDTIRPSPWDPPRDGVPAERVGDIHVEWYATSMLCESPKFRAAPSGYSWLPSTIRTMADLRKWLDQDHTAAAFWARRACLAAAETGFASWYEWSVANWGTKWSAYDYEQRKSAPGRFVFEFQTAWAPPVPVFARLAEMHPTLRFDIESIDEGGWEYAGAYVDGSGDLPEVEKNRDRRIRVYGLARVEEWERDDQEDASAEAVL